MAAIVLALGASLSYGVGDFLGGLTSRRAHVLVVLLISQAAGAVAVAVWVVVADEPFLGAGAALAAVAAGLCGVLGLAGLYRGMAIGAMGVVAPISAVSAAIPFTVGIARGERPSPLQVIGALVALAGLALVSRSTGELGARVASGVGLALVAALGFGLYFVFLDIAADDSAPWAVLVARLASTTLALFTVLAAGVSLALPRRLLFAVLAVGACDVGANVLFALATTRGLVSVVSVLTSLYPAITVALAALLLRERLGRVQLVGAAAVLAGAALLAAG
ncbi:MAG: DMT family transporter [Gaiellaceae bacterium MAG52_C11]|nr:DMT family transporter [Candidatus Gaiellasilicea maunaloa]